MFLFLPLSLPPSLCFFSVHAPDIQEVGEQDEEKEKLADFIKVCLEGSKFALNLFSASSCLYAISFSSYSFPLPTECLSLVSLPALFSLSRLQAIHTLGSREDIEPAIDVTSHVDGGEMEIGQSSETSLQSGGIVIMLCVV